MKRAFVTVSNAEFYARLLADPESCLTGWNVDAKARRGDQVPLYVGRPHSAVVAVATLAADPAVDRSPGNPWRGRASADVHSLLLFRAPLGRKALVREFPDWGFWRQPRVGCLVPGGLLPRFASLVEAAVAGQAN